ncbi:MAG: ABC-three component system protein [Veillonellales bacterium]
MDAIPLKQPSKPINASVVFDSSVDPLVRLRTISEDEFEDITCEWAYSCLSEREEYFDVVQLGGSRDSGRDLVAYLDQTKLNFDIFQCKRYKDPLTPGVYMTEFGKLCYYTFIQEYRIPRKYFIVASYGIGQSLRKLVENPETINDVLIRNWNACCAKKKKITDKGVPLTPELKTYIEQFDFSIISEVSPVRLIEEFSSTPWFKYHFGGGLKKRPIVQQPPEQVGVEEQTMPYVQQLLSVYGGHAKEDIPTIEVLKNKKQLHSHFKRQRACFYSAQSLKRFARDELINDDAYLQIKTDIYHGVVDICEKSYEDSFDRVNGTINKAQLLSVANEELKNVSIMDKSGICHELVNDEELKWIYDKDK